MSKSTKLVVDMAVWYAVSALFNIYNKKALNAMQMPWTVALIQLGAGLLLFVPLWVLRVRPVPFDSLRSFMDLAGALKSIALFATIAHVAGIIALGLGTVSFTQVIKAAEPLFTAMLSGIVLRDVLPLRSYLALLPVILGVCISSVSEVSLSWNCLLAGVVANVFAAARSVYSKAQMRSTHQASNPVAGLSAENVYSVLTILAFVMLVPVTLFAEWQPIASFASRWMAHSLTAAEAQGFGHAVFSGVLFYLYNELSFRVLHEVSPVTHALANTMKRVVIILSSVFVFGNTLTPAGKLGSALAILGTFLYSLSR